MDLPLADLRHVVHELWSLGELVHNIAKEKGWHDTERSIGDLASLLHSEATEFMEDYRDLGPLAYPVRYDASGKPCGLAVELADIIIRALDTAVKLELPLREAMVAKITYNNTRPYRHGNKLL